MEERNYGHFGRPAWTAGIAAAVALLAHLIVPFGVVDYRGPASPDDELITGWEASEMMSRVPGLLVSLNWSLGLVWTGIAVAALGSTLLLVLGYQPLKVDAARWLGASGGLLCALGGAIMLMPAMYYVGTGFSTFLGTLLFTEFDANFWAISPVLVAVAAGVVIHNGLRVMTRVSANRDGIRDDCLLHADAVRWGAVLMAAVLMVPWAIGLLPDGLSDAFGTRLQGDGKAPLFFSAQDIQGATLAELSFGGHLRYGSQEDWSTLGLALDVMLALAWTAIALGLAGALVGTARSVGMPAALDRTVRWLLAPTALLWVAAAILYLVSWFVAKPRPSPGGTFLPGFFPIIVAIVGFFLLRQHARLAGLAWAGTARSPSSA